MQRNRLPIALICLTLLGSSTAGAQCFGSMSEVLRPPAVRGMSTADPGFTVRFWAWDDFNHRRGGDGVPTLVDAGGGILLRDLRWGDAEVCHDPGPVRRTAVLFEALGPDGSGRWALVNLGSGPFGIVDVDGAQADLGWAVSTAVPVPSPRIETVRVEPDHVWVRLRWSIDRRGEALSDVTDIDGMPLPSVRGTAVYVINGPAPTSRPWDWSFADDMEQDAANGFSTDATATLRLDRDTWYDVTVCFALALTYDGNGDAEGELPDSRSVHGEYLGAPTRWIHLPPIGTDVPARITDVGLTRLSPDLLRLRAATSVEPDGASFRLWAAEPGGRRHLVEAFDGGAGPYERLIAVGQLSTVARPAYELEMVDAHERVIDAVRMEVAGPR